MIDIKNFCENLRSVLDYLARDMREKHCPNANPHARFYFPILPTANDFSARVNQWYPGLRVACPDLWSYLEGIQSYRSTNNRWLAQFNRLNNENKHDDLVEQTRTEKVGVRTTTTSRGTVTWDSSVVFEPGSSVGGVPVDPTTQLPIPHVSQRVERIVWVDFRFAGIDVSALALLRRAMQGIDRIVADTRQWL